MPAPADDGLPPLPPGLTASFDVIRPLGAGGMGAVWLVRDRFLDRSVALKVLLAERASAEQRERFLLEARTSARLEHPHIIDVYRADETDGTVWFTMRFVDGESLGGRIRERGALAPTEVARILREVSWGLAYAHARGVVHRDIKPDNILLDRDTGRAVLTDFGIARDIDAERRGLTIDGYVLGTVQYMSPEQASGEPVDARSDVYALGVVGYHALTGALPFDGPPHAVIVAHVTKPVPLVQSVAPTVRATLAAVIDRCLRKDPAERFPTADALATALDEALRDAEEAERLAADAAPGALLTEAEAQAIWQRAAQLQAAAAHHMEREMSLTAPGAKGTSAPATETTCSIRLRDVEAAAVEAGISRQYVALALAERSASTGAAGEMALSDRMDRRYTTWLGSGDRAISVGRVIPVAARRALQALGAVFTGEPHGFAFEGTVNGHPLDGGIMRFRAPRITKQGLFAQSSPAKRLLYRLEQIELFDLSVTLHGRGTAQAPACEVIVTGDLRPGLRVNLLVDFALTVGAMLLAGFGTGVAMHRHDAVAISAVALAAVSAGIATAAWYRWLFRNALEEARKELQGLLASVERHLDQQALFAGPPALFGAPVDAAAHAPQPGVAIPPSSSTSPGGSDSMVNPVKP
jgi:tRNA A-37 threonylcarbamoyl transferase component Bud32